MLVLHTAFLWGRDRAGLCPGGGCLFLIGGLAGSPCRQSTGNKAGEGPWTRLWPLHLYRTGEPRGYYSSPMVITNMDTVASSVMVI